MARKYKPWIVSRVRRGLRERAAVYRTDDDGRETGRPLVVARDGATVDDVNFAMKSIKKLPADDTAAKVAVRKALAARFLVCGRGRPQLGKATPMTLYLEADLRKTIDDLRGKMPRSTWIRQACQYVAKNEKAAAFVSEPWNE